MSADTKSIDGLAILELGRTTEEGLSVHEFEYLHGSCLGLRRESVHGGVRAYCPVDGIYSAVEDVPLVSPKELV